MVVELERYEGTPGLSDQDHNVEKHLAADSM